MSFDRRWLDEIGTEDSHGRALWGLGIAIAYSESANIRLAARYLFEKALPPVLETTSPRTWAFALIGINAYLKRISGDSKVRRYRKQLAGKLMKLYKDNASEQWLPLTIQVFHCLKWSVPARLFTDA